MKLGGRGAACLEGSDAVVVTIAPVESADITGAGDCFNAGLILGLRRGLALPAATWLGCPVGAASTGAAGGTGQSWTWRWRCAWRESRRKSR